jgi:hypothetical protein
VQKLLAIPDFCAVVRCWRSASRRAKSPSCAARPLAKSLRGSDSTRRRTQSLTNFAATRRAQRTRSTTFPKDSGRSKSSHALATSVIGTSPWMTEAPRAAKRTVLRLGVPRMRWRGSCPDVCPVKDRRNLVAVTMLFRR